MPAVEVWPRAVEAEGSFDDPAEENVLITARSGRLDRAAAERAAADVAGRLRRLPEVAKVGDPVRAPGGAALLVPVVMRGDPDSADERVGPLLAVSAVVAAMGLCGPASQLVPGVAVVVALAALYMARDVTFSALATGAVLVVAVAVLGSLTVLPALLVRLRGAVDRPRVPLVWRLTSRRGRPRLWPGLLRPALRRPGVTLALSVAAPAALALPALGMDLQPSGPETCRHSRWW
jgi:hypothetical protein